MSVLLTLVGLAVLWSYFRAIKIGIPWFSWNGKTPLRTPLKTPIRYDRLRTDNIKPKSPWLKQKQTSSKSSPIRYDRLRTDNIKPKSPWLKQSCCRTTSQSLPYHRLNELTHNQEISLRLVERIAERNPGKDAVWCIDKAVYDIKRDRMA